MRTSRTARLTVTSVALALAAGGVGTAVAAAADAAPTTAAVAAPAAGTVAVTVVQPRATLENLELVAPNGTHRHVSWLSTGWDAADVSGDGARILVRHENSYRVVDVRTGRAATVAGRWDSLGFTKPSGSALLGRPFGERMPLVRTDLAGRTTLRYASGLGWSTPADMNPTGTLVATTDDAGRIILDANTTGKIVRRLPDPVGFSQCMPGHWVDATHFTAACQPKADNALAQVFRFATDGSRPVSLTGWIPRAESAYGFWGSWSTPSGQVVGMAGACGSSYLGLAKNGHVKVLPNPVDGGPVGVAGNSAYFLGGVGECETQPKVVIRHDLATGRRTTIAGGPADAGAAVKSVVLVTKP